MPGNDSTPTRQPRRARATPDTHPVIVRRRREQARTWAQQLAERLPLRAAIVVGSVARGDLNKWSDLDVLVVADELPDDALDTACSCPDWANPCTHVAAVYYLLAEAFDDDPFLIFAWRGRAKEELLANLRARRGGREPTSPGPDDDAWPDVAAPALEACVDGFWDLGGDQAALRRAGRAPAVADALLRQLDPPEITVASVPVDEILAPAYRALVERA